MILSHKLITNNYIRSISERDIILLILIHLHIAKKINDAKLKALFKNYRKGILDRYVKNYYCSINDKWYNEERMIDVYLDIYHKIPKKDLTLEEVLPYINLLLNKNKNYCIDFIYKQIVEPIIYNIDIYRMDTINIFNSLEIEKDGEFVSITRYEDAVGLGYGYCCEEHDGDYEEYKRRNYANVVGYDYSEKLIEKAKKYLQSKKTESSYRNMNNILLQ